MPRLEEVALELFEYKVRDLSARKSVRGGVSGLWSLHDYLQQQQANLDPDDMRRLEAANRTLRRLAAPGGEDKDQVAAFDELVLGEPSNLQAELPDGPPVPRRGERPTGEQLALQRLAAKVWDHELGRFVLKVAGGLRAERERYTARLVYALNRNLHAYLRTEQSHGDWELKRFKVTEPIPGVDDPLFSMNDLDSLATLVRETIDCVNSLADPSGPYTALGVRSGGELEAMRKLAGALAADPYAGKLGMLEQRGPSSQQLRVAMHELGKENLRDEERRSQRRQLEERLQNVLAFERHQRQIFYQDVDRFTNLLEAFFDRLAKYLPRTVGGQAGPPQLPGGVLFANNPALHSEEVDPHATAATMRLKGPTRLRVGGLEVALSGPGQEVRLFLQGREHLLKEETLVVKTERKRLYAFREGEYVHLRVEDEARSVAVRVAEAGAVLTVLSSRERGQLLSVMKTLANTTVGDPQELVRSALHNVAGLARRAPDSAAAMRGFLAGAARAAGTALSAEVTDEVVRAFTKAVSAEGEDLFGALEQTDLGEVSVHTLTGEPLAVEVATFSLTVRSYGSSSTPSSLVVTLPGQSLGTFDEYLVEPLGDGMLVCVRGEQELVVGYLKASEEKAPV